jgi:hypothetical protein
VHRPLNDCATLDCVCDYVCAQVPLPAAAFLQDAQLHIHRWVWFRRAGRRVG